MSEDATESAPKVAAPALVRGRVIKVRRVSKNLAFALISSDGQVVDCVCQLNQRLAAGDYVLADGLFRQKPSSQNPTGDAQEFAIEQLQIIASSPVGTVPSFAPRSIYRIEALRARTMVEATLHRHFSRLGYTLVRTPSIVGRWADGQTGAFPVRFYEEEGYLSISRMIHHQMIQTLGYDKIYEIASLFRADDATSRKRLAEFTNIVIGGIFGVPALIEVVCDMIRTIHGALVAAGFRELSVPAEVRFEVVTYDDLLARAGGVTVSGHQLPKAVRSYLDHNFRSFVWVTGFPETMRPFFVRSNDGICEDCQLWFRGQNFLAAGGVRETDAKRVAQKIENEGKESARYAFYLEALRSGLPPIANIDLGLERFLANFLGMDPGDFTFFPRYEGSLSP